MNTSTRKLRPPCNALLREHVTVGRANRSWWPVAAWLAAGLGFAATAGAQIVVGNEVTANDIVHSYFSDDFFGSTATDFLVGQSNGATPVEFTANLGANSVFTYTMSAPTGMAFTITPAAAGTTRLHSSLRWISGSYVNPQPVASVSIAFENLSGVAPGISDNNALIASPDGQTIVMEVLTDAIGTSISFTAFSISLHYSGISSGSLAYTLHDGDLTLSSSDLSADPGQLISLSAVPEPALSALALGFAALGLVGLQRRRC